MEDKKVATKSVNAFASIDMNCLMPKTHRIVIREHLVSGKSVSFPINARELTTEQIFKELEAFEEKHMRQLFPTQLYLTHANTNRRSHSVEIAPLDKSKGKSYSFSMRYSEYSVYELAQAVSMFLCHGKVVFQ